MVRRKMIGSPFDSADTLFYVLLPFSIEQQRYSQRTIFHSETRTQTPPPTQCLCQRQLTECGPLKIFYTQAVVYYIALSPRNPIPKVRVKESLFQVFSKQQVNCICLLQCHILKNVDTSFERKHLKIYFHLPIIP